MATAIASTFTPKLVEEQEVAGSMLGTIERRYGLLRCEETITIEQVFNRSGDLAVADRLAYVYAGRTHGQVVVFERDGWYYVGTLDQHLSCEQAACLRPARSDSRLLSLVDERGIAPIVAPLVRRP